MSIYKLFLYSISLLSINSIKADCQLNVKNLFISLVKSKQVQVKVDKKYHRNIVFGNGRSAISRLVFDRIPYIEKRYRTTQKFYKELDSYSLLKKFTQLKNNTFKLIRIFNIDKKNKIINFEFIKGVSLQDYLVNSIVPVNERIYMADLFKYRLKMLSKHIKIYLNSTDSQHKYEIVDSNLSVEVWNNTHPEFGIRIIEKNIVDKSKKIIDIYIKPSNVIITLDGDLVIIDAY